MYMIKGDAPLGLLSLHFVSGGAPPSAAFHSTRRASNQQRNPGVGPSSQPLSSGVIDIHRLNKLLCGC